LQASNDFLRAKNIFKYEYDLLFVFVIFSGACLCFCNEFLLIYLAIELQSLTLYVFATFNRNSEFSTESGLKYFVFGGVMSCFLLFGLSLIYLFFGSLSFEVITTISNYGSEPLFFCGFLFILVVFLFKVGAVPFHLWLCDVYEGSILPVTMLFASAPKIVLFGLILKLCFSIFCDYDYIWSVFIGFSATSSIITGAICATHQKRLKRLFAYSTIAHTGFILLAFLSFSLDTTKSLIFYIVIYSILTITTFAILINAGLSVSTQPKYLINFSSIGSKNTVFAFTFGLTILAIAGIPPLAGFFSKLFVLISVIGAEYTFTAFVIIVFSTVSCYYYIRLVKILFFTKDSKNNLWITNGNKQNTEIIIGISLVFILCFFLQPELVIDFSIAIGCVLF
jgi:NADH-quinone oxidoreductase subunit N